MFLATKKVTFSSADGQQNQRALPQWVPCFDRVEDVTKGLCFGAAMLLAWLAAGPATKTTSAAFATILLGILVACVLRRATFGKAAVCSLRFLDCLLLAMQAASLALLVSRLQTFALVAVYSSACLPSSLSLQQPLCRLAVAVVLTAFHPFDTTGKIVIGLSLIDAISASMRLGLLQLCRLHSPEEQQPQEALKVQVNTAIGLLAQQAPNIDFTSNTSMQKFSVFHDAESNGLFSAKGQITNRFNPISFSRVNDRVSGGAETSDTKVSTDLETASRSNKTSKDRIHSNILNEYFTMIEDLMVLADEELSVVSNNYSKKPDLSIPAAIKSSIGLRPDAGLKVGTSLSQNLDLKRDSPTKCNEQTLRQLIRISEALEFKRRKADYYHLNKFRQKDIDSCLFEIERHEELLNQRELPNAFSSKSHFSSNGNARASLREVNYLQAGLIVASTDPDLQLLRARNALPLARVHQKAQVCRQ